MKKSIFTSRRALASLLPLVLLAVVAMFCRNQLGQNHAGSSSVHGNARGDSSGDAAFFTTAVGGNSDAAQAPPAHPVASLDASRPPERQLVARQEKVISSAIPPDFLKQILSADEKTATIPLPGGGTARGVVTFIQRDDNGLLLVQGNVTEPEAGKFMFQRQTVAGIAGSMAGHIHYDKSDVAYQVRPTGENGGPMLVQVPVDEVICRALLPYANAAETPEQAPQTHPTNYPIPPSENGVIQLQSLPSATAVVYLDFDGEAESFPSWGYINALPSGSTNAQIYDVWKGIAEDYQPFNINITTVRSVYDAAPDGGRMHVIFTPTNDAAPGAGGVAYVGSFNQTGHRVCWVFYTSGKSAVEAGSHEIGHTVGLSHDGRTSPSEGYYGGHNGWAPIMGVGYYQTISQWSKGEYPSANQTQNDLNIIVSNNNSVDYRVDDYGSTYAASAWLDVASGGVVSNEGIIETTGDQDAFRFSTSGGNASFNINNVSFNPNLDIKAEIVSSAGVVVSTSNLDTTASASFSSLSLAAGDYFLRVTGAGKGEADLSTGYTNYGSLGSYLITGTITGGVTADHFTVAENTAVGSAVGTSAPRVSHGVGVLTRSITSGNASGAFTINSATGAITVANSSILDFETLSSRWDDPASFELFVSITDSLGVATESIRTVVTISDANELPVVAALAAQALPENLAVGTIIATASAVDPDRTDYITFSIAGGNTGNAFAINSATGVITVTGALDFETTPSYTLTVRTTDHGTPANNVDIPLAINLVNTVEGYVPGTIIRAFYNNISGSTVANLTSNAKFPNSADSLTTLTSFDGGADKGDNYGSTICGYLIPPATGNYTFWISSDDASELRISPDTSPANAVARASVATFTSQYAWTANASQQSIAIALTAGQPYYIEARQKEGGGGDHLAVAWQGPGMAVKELIPGRWLAPVNVNYAPNINVASYTIRENALPGQVVGTVTSSDVNPTDVSAGYTITAGNTGGVFAINPASGQLSLAKSGLLNATTTPSYSLTIQATDNGTPPLSGSGTVTVNVAAATGISATGVVQEIWTGLSAGTTVSDLTGNANYPYKPNMRRVLASFDSGTYYGDYYGSRIRAKFIPPSSGDYQFYISSDDDSRLLFSSNPSGAGAVQIASLSSFSNPYEWTKFASQTSAVQTLVAGQAIYLETLQKEGISGDHVSVGYTGPGTATVTVIPGSMLQPFDINVAPVFSPSSYTYSFTAATATAGMAIGTVTATEPNAETLVYGILSGNATGAFAINQATGAITVTNPALLGNGDVTLQVSAQDGGLGGVYPLASATATVVMHIAATNSTPTFTSDPIPGTGATQNVAYSASLAGSATDVDAGEILTFSKVSGPAWLNIASNGTLTGTPTGANIGPNSFVVRVTDGGGLSDDATLNVSVTLANPAADSDGDGFTDALEFALGSDFQSAGSQPNSIYADLRAWWKFDETSGTLADDTTGRPQDGTVNGGATWGASIDGGALTFDGVNDGVLVGTSAALTGTTDLTLSAWVKVAPGSSGGVILQQRDATSAGYNGEYMLIVKSGGAVEFFIYRDGFQFDITTTAAVNDGQWHRVTATRSGTDGAIHIDGTQAATGSGAIKSLASLEVAIGYDYRDSINYFNGSIDDVRIYSRALSALEIGTLADYIAPVFIADPMTGSGATEDSVYTATLAGRASDASIGDTLSFSKVSGPAWLSIAPNGALAGTPGNSDVGANSFAVRVTDSTGLSGNATLNIAVANVNDAPVFAANPINLSGTEHSNFAGQLTASDIDAGDVLTYSKVSGPVWLAVSSTGALSGTPGNADVGANIFVVGVSDGVTTVTAALNITVADANDAPVFSVNPLDGGSLLATAAYTGDLAPFASDADSVYGDTISFSKTSGPVWLSVAANGALSGTPGSANQGVNSFVVRVTDTAGLFAETTLNFSVTVDGVWIQNANDSWLTATNWSGGASPNGLGSTASFATINITADRTVTLDSAVTLSSMTFGDTTASHNWILNAGTGGLLALNITTGTPAITVNNQTATINVPISGTKGLLKSGAGTLTLAALNTLTGNVTVNGGILRNPVTVNNASPTATGLGNMTTAGRLVTINTGAVLSFDSPDAIGQYNYKTPVVLVADGGTITRVSGSFNSLGDITLKNGAHLTSVNGQNATVNSFALNGNITVSGTSGSFIDTTGTSNNGLHLGTAGTTNVFDVAATGDATADLIVSAPLIDKTLGGTAGFTKTGAGKMVLTGANTFTGATTVTDGTLLANNTTGSATGTGAVAVAATATLGGIGTVSGSVTVNGTLAPGNGIGTLTTGALTLAPASGIAFQLNNWNGTAGTGYDKVAATSVNLTATQAQPVQVVITPASLVNFTNVTKSFTLATTTGGITGFAANKFSINATAIPAATGTWSVQQSGNNLLLVHTAPNLAPVFTADPFSRAAATEDAAYTGTIAGAAADGNAGDVLSYSKISGPAWLTVSSNGALSGTPANGNVGSNGFIVRVTDSTSLFAEATLNISVTNTNDAPVFVANPINLNGTGDSAFTGQLAASDVDDGDTLTYSKVSGTAWLTVSGTGALSGTPTNAEVGANAFTVRVTDGSNASADATLNITVASVNDAPVFTANPINGGSAAATAAYTGAIASSASDPNAGDTLAFSKTSGPAWLAVAADGALSGTPGLGDSGANSFTVRVTDGGGLFAETTLSITITLTPTQTWQSAQFGANASNPLIAGDDADPDGDGLKNLLEYALGTNPNTTNTSGILHDMEFVSGTDYLRLTVNKNAAATDVIFTAETCSDFSDWSSASTAEETNTASQLIVRDTVTGPRRFIRLKVSR